MLLRALFGERKAVGFDDKWIAMLAGETGARSRSGVSVTTDTALMCTTALACTRALATGVAMLPRKLVRDGARGEKLAVADSPLAGIVAHRPNDWMTGLEWVETMMMHAVLAQAGRSFINRVNGQVAELIPLVPERTTVHQGEDYALTYRVQTAKGNTLTLRRDQVFDFRGPTWDGFTGLDIRKLAREAIGLSLATEESHARLHGQGARPGGILSTEQTLTQPQVAELRENWDRMQGGVANAMRTAILGGGMKWQALAMTGVDSQHIETRRHQIEEVCRGFGVFPAVIGHSSNQSTYASVEQFFLQHVILSLGPWFTRLENRLTADLLSPEERGGGLYFHITAQAMLRGDHKTRAEFYRALVMLGVMTRNEVRLLEEMSPLPGLDEPILPLNVGVVGADGNPEAGEKFIAAVAEKVAALIAPGRQD